jgi:chemotaxis signal transduction protein
MKELEDTSAKRPPDAPRETRELFVLSAGGQLFAVGAEETDGVAEGLTPAPLPRAPAAVLGVVSVRGRMRTLLYPPALFTQSHARESSRADADAAAPRFIVALVGDEQLALAADAVEGVITVNAEPLVGNVNAEPLSASDTHESPSLATLEHEGRRLQLLDTSRLFDAAMRGTERRRPRA